MTPATISLNDSDSSVKFDYQTPVITELEANELTQSAAQVMTETNGGYYS